MLLRAKKSLNRYPNLYLHKGDGKTLPSQFKNYFDLIYSFFVFNYHLHDPSVIKSYIHDSFRSLKKGGLLLIDIGSKMNFRIVERYFGWAKNAHFSRFLCELSQDSRITGPYHPILVLIQMIK